MKRFLTAHSCQRIFARRRIARSAPHLQASRDVKGSLVAAWVLFLCSCRRMFGIQSQEKCLVGLAWESRWLRQRHKRVHQRSSHQKSIQRRKQAVQSRSLRMQSCTKAGRGQAAELWEKRKKQQRWMSSCSETTTGCGRHCRCGRDVATCREGYVENVQSSSPGSQPHIGETWARPSYHGHEMFTRGMEEWRYRQGI